MGKISRLWALCILLCGQSFFLAPVNANIGMAVSYGEGVRVDEVQALRGAFNWDFGAVLFKEYAWGVNLHWETALAAWQGRATTERPNDDLYFVSTGPVFRLQKNHPKRDALLPYVEVGVSPSWLTQREISGRKLSIHFQFEDKFGLGCRFGRHHQFDVFYRFIHYSNATIKRPNSGVNIQMINLGYWFN